MGDDPQRPTSELHARSRFVLVRPQSPGNLGSAARALKNLGFSRIELVSPAFSPEDPEARKMAVDARDLLPRVGCHDALDGALADAQTVVALTRRTGKQRRPHWRLDELAPELASRAEAGQLAFLFGAEDSGLTDLECDRATHLVYLHASEEYPSFNLAQAVLLVAYELTRSLTDAAPAALDPPADHTSREAMYRHLQDAFLAIGYVSDETVESIVRRYRRLLGRAGPTSEEVQLLRGLARQTLWAARQAGLAPPSERDDP